MKTVEDVLNEVSEDLIFKATLGQTKKEFLRTAKLMLNPKKLGDRLVCPVCEKNIKVEPGGFFCEGYSCNYDATGGCFWHRYEDGTNYWTSPAELIKVLSKKTGIPLPKNM